MIGGLLHVQRSDMLMIFTSRNGVEDMEIKLFDTKNNLVFYISKKDDDLSVW